MTQGTGHRPTIHTVGHSTHPLEEFIALLKNHHIEYLVDVRTMPRSRTNPQFNSDSLPTPLQQRNIAYSHITELGGLRSRRKGDQSSPNTFWENKSFRNYADYAMTASFRLGLEQLKAIAAQNRCAIMCAEAVWWRCHRRIIADYLMAEDYPVRHIMGFDKAEPAKMTPGATPAANNAIIYAG